METFSRNIKRLPIDKQSNFLVYNFTPDSKKDAKVSQKIILEEKGSNSRAKVFEGHALVEKLLSLGYQNEAIALFYALDFQKISDNDISDCVNNISFVSSGTF